MDFLVPWMKRWWWNERMQHECRSWHSEGPHWAPAMASRDLSRWELNRPEDLLEPSRSQFACVCVSVQVCACRQTCPRATVDLVLFPVENKMLRAVQSVIWESQRSGVLLHFDRDGVLKNVSSTVIKKPLNTLVRLLHLFGWHNTVCKDHLLSDFGSVWRSLDTSTLTYHTQNRRSNPLFHMKLGSPGMAKLACLSGTLVQTEISQQQIANKFRFRHSWSPENEA